MPYKTALIVPTFSQNSSNIVDALIESINNQSIREVDIIVVNNNLFSLQLHNKLNKGEIFILNGKKNLWSAGWFYLGMKFAYNRWYDVYILGDDDAVLLDGEALDVLARNSFNNGDIAFQLTWKERKDMGLESSAAYSCYGAFSHRMLTKYGFYSQFFFYGWEDAAYEWMLRAWWIGFTLLSPMFSHPVKQWMTLSRWSSWLSVFRHNSILQHFWNIFFHPSVLTKACSVIVINVYIAFLFYGTVWFERYFRSQMLLNLRNSILYIPPILIKRTWTLLYPKYRDSRWDQEYIMVDSQYVTTLSDRWLQLPLSGSKSEYIALTTWFPVATVWWRSWISQLWGNKDLALLHGQEDNGALHLKILMHLGTSARKIFVLAVSVLIAPVIAILTISMFVLLFLKYAGIVLLLYIQESRYFGYYTSKE